jgi:hypothetical protein
MTIFWLRVVVAALLFGILFVAAVPLFLLLDLTAGGTGRGLCPNGLAGCETPYTAGPELAAILIIAMFVLVAGVRFAMRTIRKLESGSGRLTIWNLFFERR